MEDSNPNKINIDDDEEEEANPTYCPYKKVTNFLGGFFGGNNQSSQNDNPKLSKNETEKPKCPFGFTSSSTKKKTSQGRCPFGFGAQDDSDKDKKTSHGRCPFGFGAQDDNSNIKKEKKEENEKNASDEDSGDEEPRGGCPVMGKGRLDPKNKDFEEFYEIPCFGNYDFMFFLRGGLSQEEWIEKTKKMRKYPRHLKYTLFYQNQDKLKEVHKAEFPRVFFIYDDIKQKGIRLYNRKKYREALEHLNYAYGLLRWIEFKDKKRQADFVVKPSLDGILDDEIEEKKCYLDAPDVEEESYKACVVYILEIMAYCHMELRQYTNAIECLDECEEVAGNLVPDVFFRRAQARMFNRYSTDEDLKKAKEDIERAIKFGEKYNEEIKKKYGENITYYKKPVDLEMYGNTSKKLDKIMEARLDLKTYNVRRILGKVYGNKKKNENDMTDDEAIFFESCIFNSSSDLERRNMRDFMKYTSNLNFFINLKLNQLILK